MKKKKHKPKPLGNIAYVVELRRWLKMPELLAYHKELHENRNKPLKSEEIPEIVEAISYFIESKYDDNGGPPTSTNCFVERIDDDDDEMKPDIGHYKGLARHLEDDGFSRKARMRITLREINYAWRVYRRRCPPPKILSLAQLEQQAGVQKAKSNSLWGIKISALLRAMGKEGFTLDEARKIMKHFDLEVVDHTIKGQLWCGTQRGKYGDIPKLQEWQINKLYEAMR